MNNERMSANLDTSCAVASQSLLW